MSNNFVVKNTLIVGNNFTANSSNIVLGNVNFTPTDFTVGNSTANVFANSSYLFVGNSSSNVIISSVGGIFSLTVGGTPFNSVMSSAAQYWANAAGIVVTTDKLNAAGTYTVLTDATTINWNHALGMNFAVTLAGNRTLAFPTNPIAGRSGTLLIKQDATANRTLAFATGFVFDSDTAPIIGNIANKYTLLFWHYIDSTHCLITMAARNFT